MSKIELLAATPTPSYRPQIAVTFFAFILMGAYAAAGGVLLPSLGTFYKIDSSTLGFLFLAATLGYLVSSFSSGLLTERLGEQRFLLLGTITFLVGTFLMSLKPLFVLVLIPRVIQGAGMGIIETGFNTYVARLPRSTSILNNLHAFYGVGALIGPIIASTILVINWSWSTAYLLWAIVSIPLLIACGLLFRTTSSSQTQQEQEPANERQGNVLLDILRLRAVWLATLFLFFYVGIELSVGNWGFTFLTIERHQDTLLAGWIVSGYWLGLTLGRFLLSSLFERFGLSIAQLLQSCAGIVILGILIAWFFPLDWLTAFGFAVIGFGLGPIYPTTVAIMPKLVPARLVSSAIGFLISVSIPGITLFPWIAGIIAQHIGWWSLLPYSILLTLAMLGFWLSLRGSIKASQ